MIDLTALMSRLSLQEKEEELLMLRKRMLLQTIKSASLAAMGEEKQFRQFFFADMQEDHNQAESAMAAGHDGLEKQKTYRPEQNAPSALPAKGEEKAMPGPAAPGSKNLSHSAKENKKKIEAKEKDSEKDKKQEEGGKQKNSQEHPFAFRFDQS